MSVLAIDTETHRFRPGDMAPRIVCLSWRDDHESGLLDRRQAEQWLARQLGRAIDGCCIIVAHYAAYDFACALATWPDLGPLVWTAYARGVIQCTVVREKLLDIAKGHLRGRRLDDETWLKHGYTLEDIALRRLDVSGLDKGADSWRTRYGELDGVPLDQWPERAVRYAKLDAELCWRLYNNQAGRSQMMGYTMPTQDDEVRADLALRLATVWGIRTDGERVRRLRDGTEARMVVLRAELVSAGIIKAKKGSHHKDTAVIRSMVEQSWPGGAVLPQTPKGATSTAAETLKACSTPVLRALVEFNTLEKAGSTYIRRLFDGIDRPIHAEYQVLGAASSRTSCRGPNLQNQPRLPGVRECFVPRPGRVFVACDFDSQEMRTLAQSCLDTVGVSRLAEQYQENVDYDPHQELADIHGVSRQHSKICNFGLPGGMGVRGLVRYAKGYGVTLSENEAALLRDAWFAQWPEMRQYFDYINVLLFRGGQLARVEIKQSGFVRDGCKYTDAANTHFQSLAAHASKAALWEVSRRCYGADRESWLYGCRPVLFIHDEIIIEAFEEFAHEAAMEMRKVMVEAMARYTPDVPPAASATVMRWWSKKAEPVWRGRLVPWEGP